MKKRILNIQLVKTPSLRHGKRQHQPNCGWFNGGDKGVIIINSKALFETLGNQSCFVAINWSMSLMLDLVHPFAIYKISAGLWRNQSPCLVFIKAPYSSSIADFHGGVARASWMVYGSPNEAR
jgi:hypothetical protein